MRKSTYDEENIKEIALDRAILSSSQEASTRLILDRAREFENYLNYDEVKKPTE